MWCGLKVGGGLEYGMNWWECLFIVIDLSEWVWAFGCQIFWSLVCVFAARGSSLAMVGSPRTFGTSAYSTYLYLLYLLSPLFNVYLCLSSSLPFFYTVFICIPGIPYHPYKSIIYLVAQVASR